MSNVRFYISMLILCFCFSAFAQETTGTGGNSNWECPEGFAGQSIEILTWAAYLTESIVADFEERCDVDVTFTEYDDEYFMFDTMRLGNPGYDLLIVSGTMVHILAEEGLTIPLDHSRIPNIVNVAESFLTADYDPENQYSIPFLWGALAVAYREELFPEGLNSWEQVWNHDGKVYLLNDYRAMIGIGLLNLGYDPNTIEADEISAARDYLGEHGANIESVYSAIDTSRVLADPTTDIALVYINNLALYWQECACTDYKSAIPHEGSNIYVDNMLIPVDGDNPELAMAFMDYVLDPVVNASISNAAPSSTNAAAADLGLIDERYLAESGFNPSDEILENMFFINPLDEDIAAYYELSWNDLLLYFGTYPE